LEFSVQDLWFRVHRLGAWVYTLDFRVQGKGSRFKIQRLSFRIKGLWIIIEGKWFWVEVLRMRVSAVEFGVWCLWFRV
jgi:hypothetical protein